MSPFCILPFSGKEVTPTPKPKQLPPDVQKRAVAYARYSSAGQRDVSIEQQLRDIHAYAQREGYTIVHEYADHAKSGFRHIDARVAFNSMMEAAKTGSFGAIIVWKVDRFGRSREDSAIYKGRLRQWGVRVIYAMEPIPEGSAGVLLEGMLEATAEWYSRNLSENVTRGMHDNASKSLYNGNSYYGYSPGPDGHYIINSAEAPVVRQIYDWYLSGMSSSSILRELNARGLTRSGRPFTYNVLLHILHNERYTGVYIWRDYRNEGGMPAIITREQWEEVQRQLSKRQKRESKSPVDFLLTGKLFCGHCGTAMVGDSGTSRTRNTHYYYTCYNHKNRKSCDKRSIRKEVIEEAVINYLLDVALNPDIISRLADLVLAEQQAAQKHSVLTSLRSEQASVHRKITNLNNAIADGVYTSSTLTMLQNLESEAHSLADAIAAAEFSESQLLTRERILYWMNRFTHGDRTDPNFTERLVNIFLNAVYLYDTDDGPRMRVLLNAVSNDPPVPLSELPPIGSDSLSPGVRKKVSGFYQRPFLCRNALPRVRLGQAVHLRLAQHAEALRPALQAAQAEVDGAQAQVQADAPGSRAVRRELAQVAAEDSLQLPVHMPAGGNIAVGPGGHVVSKGANGRGLRAIARHDAPVARHAGQAAHGLPHVQVIRVALAVHAGIRRKQHLRLRFANHPRNARRQILRGVEASVRQVQEAHVLHAQLFGGATCLLPAGADQLLPLEGGVLVAVATVRADEERHLLAQGDQAGRGGPCADLDIVRVGADEQVAVEGLHPGQRRRHLQGQAGQAHAASPFRRASSAQIRSYSPSSSL